MMGVEFLAHPDNRLYGYLVEWGTLVRPRVVVAELIRREAGNWMVVMLDEDGQIIQGAGVEGSNNACKRALLHDGVLIATSGEATLTWSGSKGYLVTGRSEYPMMFNNLRGARSFLEGKDGNQEGSAETA